MSIFKKFFDILGPSVTKFAIAELVMELFPNHLKIAKDTHISKACNKNIMSSYWPISILPAYSKILENIVYGLIAEYFTFYNLVSPTQFGFRSA